MYFDPIPGAQENFPYINIPDVLTRYQVAGIPRSYVWTPTQCTSGVDLQSGLACQNRKSNGGGNLSHNA